MLAPPAITIDFKRFILRPTGCRPVSPDGDRPLQFYSDID
jgi:hypothetical protein